MPGVNSPDARRLGILHVASGDLWGGAEAMVLDLAIAQQRLGHDVAVALFNEGLLADRLRTGGISTRVFPESGIGPIGLLMHVRQLCRELRPDVLHTHRMKETVIGAAAARLAGVRACVRTVHGDNEHQLPWYAVRKALARFAERMSCIALVSATVAVSHELGARLALRWPSSRIVIIENGVDVERIRQEAADGTGRPRRQDGRARIGLVGRLVPVKRADLFLDACAALADQSVRKIEAVIVGDGPMLAELEQRASRINAVNWTFTGFVDRPGTLIRDFDLLAITSDHEGLPICLLEALALGVPVVARAVGGIPPLLSDGTHGRLVDSSNAESIATVMREVLEQSVVNQQAGNRGPFPATLTAETSARRYVDLYAGLTGTDSESRSTRHL